MYLSGQPIYGYGSMDDVLFRNAPTKDGDIFFVEDKEISLRELAMNVVIPTDPGQRSVKGEISVSQFSQNFQQKVAKERFCFMHKFKKNSCIMSIKDKNSIPSSCVQGFR